jgi:DNA-binding winged helix-turn-helix (wHTH) protein
MRLLTEARVQALTGEIMVGDWAFSPESASLARGGERRRLEHRAARVLELLCRRRGAPVSTAELVENVWEGRSLSHNSVAVVIADLRRALDDDSRRPRYIETIPKRGYRLLAPVAIGDAAGGETTIPLPEPAGPARYPRRAMLGALLAAALLGVATLIFSATRAPAPFVVTIAPIPNETGNPAYDPLAPAVTDLVAAHVGGVEGVRIVRGEGARIDARIGGRLVLWNRQASLSLSAEDPATGIVLWSAIAAGPAEALPRQIDAAIANFAATVAARREGRGDGGATGP